MKGWPVWAVILMIIIIILAAIAWAVIDALGITIVTGQGVPNWKKRKRENAKK